MKKKFCSSVIFVILLSFMGIQNMNAQQVTDTTKVKAPTAGAAASNVMLNASSDNGPRVINIGLPSGLGGTTILENGIPVTYDFQSQGATTVWRQDGSFRKFGTLDIYKTAITAGDIGVSVATYSNRGTDEFRGAAGFSTNTYGLLRGNINVSGPMKNGFTYALSGFVNMDPNTVRSAFARNLDETQILRGTINKKYKTGQIGLQYKLALSRSINHNQNPYYYRKDGSVDAMSGKHIGQEAYIERSGIVHPYNMFTGKQEAWDMTKDAGSTSHVFDILGDNTFANGMKLDYTVRLHFAKSGFWNPNNLSFINPATDPLSPQEKDNRYIYADGSNNIYTGNVQTGTMVSAQKWSKQGLYGRFELSKKSDKHDWMIGLSEWYYNANDAYRASYGYNMTVETNPQALIRQQYINGAWVNRGDQYGAENHNAAMQFYDGVDNKLALYATEKWSITDKFIVDLGARLEWQNIDGYWAPQEIRGKSPDGKAGMITDKRKIGYGPGEATEWLNKNFTVNGLYKAFDHAGFTIDGIYAEKGGMISDYAVSRNPNIKQSQILGGTVGVYFNHPMISMVSKLNYIQRSNYLFNGLFVDKNGDQQRETLVYDVNTLGWTTDVILNPFKGFNLHLLLTMQNPKYDKFDFNLKDINPDKYNDQRYEFSGNTVKSVSKVLVEIDPSYTWKKYKVWASARYFSKEYAAFSNSVFFAPRWETFAGFDYQHSKTVNFSVNVVNLLNQTGAQGSITGADLVTDGSWYYDKLVAGTYIRPFTVEFKTNIRF